MCLVDKISHFEGRKAILVLYLIGFWWNFVFSTLQIKENFLSISNNVIVLTFKFFIYWDDQQECTLGGYCFRDMQVIWGRGNEALTGSLVRNKINSIILVRTNVLLGTIRTKVDNVNKIICKIFNFHLIIENPSLFSMIQCTCNVLYEYATYSYKTLHTLLLILLILLYLYAKLLEVLTNS